MLDSYFQYFFCCELRISIRKNLREVKPAQWPLLCHDSPTYDPWPKSSRLLSSVVRPQRINAFVSKYISFSKSGMVVSDTLEIVASGVFLWRSTNLRLQGKTIFPASFLLRPGVSISRGVFFNLIVKRCQKRLSSHHARKLQLETGSVWSMIAGAR